MPPPPPPLIDGELWLDDLAAWAADYDSNALDGELTSASEFVEVLRLEWRAQVEHKDLLPHGERPVLPGPPGVVTPLRGRRRRRRVSQAVRTRRSA